jgi:hypothetical protein
MIHLFPHKRGHSDLNFQYDGVYGVELWAKTVQDFAGATINTVMMK